MKKFFALLLSMIMLVQAVPAALAQSDTKAILTSATAKQGEQVTVTVEVQNCADAKSIYIVPQFDGAVLEIVSGTWLLDGMLVDDWSASFGDAAIAFADNTDINGEIFQFVFNIKENAPAGVAAKVGCEIVVMTLDGKQEKPVAITVVAGTITVEGEKHTHAWGKGAVTTPATCTAEGVLTYTCACGETKTEAIAATGHSFGDWVTVVAPTAETEGKAERKCACGETESKTLPKLEARPRLGDVNNDGRLSAKDATMILRWVVRKLTDVPAHFEQVADVNDDGKISAKDATMILRFVVNKGDIPGWER